MVEGVIAELSNGHKRSLSEGRDIWQLILEDLANTACHILSVVGLVKPSYRENGIPI